MVPYREFVSQFPDFKLEDKLDFKGGSFDKFRRGYVRRGGKSSEEFERSGKTRVDPEASHLDVNVKKGKTLGETETSQLDVGLKKEGKTLAVTEALPLE